MYQQLIDCCTNGNIHQLNNLMPMLDANNKNIALKISAKNNNVHLVQMLIEAGADLFNYETLLCLIKNERIGLLEMIGKKNPKLLKEVLRIAVLFGNHNFIHKLLDTIGFSINDFGVALIEACEGNNLYLVNLFIKLGVPSDSMDQAVYATYLNGNEIIARILFDAGSTNYKYGLTLFVGKKGHSDYVSKMLQGFKSNIDYLHSSDLKHEICHCVELSCQFSDVETVKILFNFLEDLNISLDRHLFKNWLQASSYGQNMEIVNFLISKSTESIEWNALIIGALSAYYVNDDFVFNILKLVYKLGGSYNGITHLISNNTILYCLNQGSVSGYEHEHLFDKIEVVGFIIRRKAIQHTVKNCLVELVNHDVIKFIIFPYVCYELPSPK